MTNYGKAIKRLRVKNEYTQKELADKIGVSDKTVSKWENGVNQPDMDMVIEICRLFGVSVDEFIKLAKDCDDKENANGETFNDGAVTIKNSSRRFRSWVYLVSFISVFVAAAVIAFLCLYLPMNSNRALTPTQIYRKVNPSVFFIEVDLGNNSKSGGSGFFIDSNGTAVTNYHVIAGGKSAKVIMHDGKEYQVEKILGKHESSDLVIIKVDVTGSKPVSIANSQSVQTGDKVYAIGYPEAFKVGVESSTFTEGTVSKSSYTLAGETYIQTSADVTHGNSGGVLVNDKGAVIGITTAKLNIAGVDYMNLALPSNKIRNIEREFNWTLGEFNANYIAYNVTFINEGQTYFVQSVFSGYKATKQQMEHQKVGYTFAGWYTQATGGEQFDFNTLVTEAITLYARWSKITYAIEFNGGADDVVGEQSAITVTYGEEFELPECEYERDGYIFVGWKLSEDVVLPAGSYVVSLASKEGEVVILTACWE